MKLLYRVIEYRPGVFRIQERGLLWGWNYSLDMADCPAEWTSAMEAEKVINKWLDDAAHVVHVVTEFWSK